MKVKRSETSDGNIELQITVPPDKVLQAIKFIEFQLAIQNEIDPNATEDLTTVIKEKVGEAYYSSFVNFQVMNFLAPFAVTQEKISIIGAPKVESTEVTVVPGKELSFRATVIPKPIYEMDDFSPVKIQIPKVEISEEEIDQQLLKIAESYAVYKRDEDRPVQDGDDILFSIKTVDSKGEEVPQLTAESRAYSIGQKFIPGDFDDQLIGIDVGQTKTFDVTCEEFNPSEMLGHDSIDDSQAADDSKANETFTFTVTILEIQKRVIPAITDTWVRELIPNLSTVPELREEIRKQGIEFKEKDLDGMKSYIAASEFAKRFKGSIADELYEMTREDIMRNMQQSLQAQGKTLKEYAKEVPGGEQQFSMQLMLQTREVLIQGFTLDALARHLKLEVTPQDIEETFHLMAPGHEQEARMEFEMTGRMYQIEEGALRNKANQWLVENAEIDYYS